MHECITWEGLHCKRQHLLFEVVAPLSLHYYQTLHMWELTTYLTRNEPIKE